MVSLTIPFAWITKGLPLLKEQDVSQILMGSAERGLCNRGGMGFTHASGGLGTRSTFSISIISSPREASQYFSGDCPGTSSSSLTMMLWSPSVRKRPRPDALAVRRAMTVEETLIAATVESDNDNDELWIGSRLVNDGEWQR